MQYLIYYNTNFNELVYYFIVFDSPDSWRNLFLKFATFTNASCLLGYVMNTIRRSERIRSRARPQPPALQTSTRKRNYHIPSQEEREEAELEQIRKYKFTAKPAPDHVFRGAAPVGIPPKTKRKGTVPKTPEAMKHKVASRRGITKAKQPTNKAVKRLKALPLPDLMKVFEVTKKERTTKPAPFSFEKKYPKPREVAQKLIEEAVLKEKQQREFRAQPLFETEAFTVDKNMSKSCTKVEPFKLSHPTAHEDKLKKIDETINKENEELKKKREFQAKYPYVLYDPAFVPDKPSRICEVDLHQEIPI